MVSSASVKLQKWCPKIKTRKQNSFQPKIFQEMFEHPVIGVYLFHQERSLSGRVLEVLLRRLSGQDARLNGAAVHFSMLRKFLFSQTLRALSGQDARARRNNTSKTRPPFLSQRPPTQLEGCRSPDFAFQPTNSHFYKSNSPSSNPSGIGAGRSQVLSNWINRS